MNKLHQSSSSNFLDLQRDALDRSITDSVLNTTMSSPSNNVINNNMSSNSNTLNSSNMNVNINTNSNSRTINRISSNRLTKYEMVRIIGERTKQLTLGAKPLIKNQW